jgi:adenylate cyclase
MKPEYKRRIKSRLTTCIISAFATSVFMYLFYFPGWQSIAAGLNIGFFIPLILTWYSDSVVRKHLVKTNLILLLSINTLVNVLVMFVISVIFVIIFYVKGNFREVFQNMNFFYSRWMLTGISFGLGLALIFNFFYILNTLIGRHILGKLFIGMYRKPVETERVFMFLDIKSSTSIAEQIGHQKFMSLVNDFFYDIAEPVYVTKGEIYKYVGDEAIITWKMKHAITDANCIRCFTLIKEAIRKKAKYYETRYGVVPEFKAGLHGGLAITGELGYTKREIAYMGDVLNTTARIEEACKTYKEALLVSEVLVTKLQKQSVFSFQKVGKEKFRGKENEIALYKVEK